MGFFDFIGDIIDPVVDFVEGGIKGLPAATGKAVDLGVEIVKSDIGKAVTNPASVPFKVGADFVSKKLAPNYNDFGGRTPDISSVERNNMSFFNDITSGLGSFASGLTNLASPINQLGSLFGSDTNIIGGNAIATQRSGARASETSTSGQLTGGQMPTNEAFIGGLGGIANVASKFLRTPGGQIGGGLLAGGALSLFDGQPKKMRVTKKMRSQARMVLNMMGGDLSRASAFLNISQQELVAILLKRFRNDGAVITKAALRKTKTTIRRLKSMCDTYDDLRPAAKRRASPMKRASRSTTLIKN